MRDPSPIHPMSLIWRRDNPHPALAALSDHLVAFRPERSDDDVIWVPDRATSRFDVEKPRPAPLTT